MRSGSVFEPVIVLCRVRQVSCRPASPCDEVQACVAAKKRMKLRSVRRTAIAILLSGWAGLLFGAPNDFYPALLKRGIAHVGSSNFDMAAKELRIAAFGLVDDVPQFEIAQIYLTIAAQKLGREPDARHAAQRVLAAERLEQHYASLNLPADIRASFEKIVNQILTSDQVAALHARPVVPVQQQPQPPTPQSQSPAPIIAQPPAPITPGPKSPAPIVVPMPAPAPKSPAPIKPQPVAPIVVPTSPQPDPGKPIISHEAPMTPIELPPAAPRAEVEPPSVPSGPRITKPPNPVPTQTPAPKPAPVPAPAPATPTPAPPPATAALSAAELSKRLSAADAALAKNDLLSARAVYRTLVETPGLDHAASMRIAEGSYRARDFATAIRAFEHAGGFRKGEEPYHYYLAVSLYETGRYNAAKRELAAALPYIEVTPDIARYRIKIEGAIE
jgi:tetratricopeptide (TPR) repeat protein